jgi:GT2 family glycosyltransferase
MSSLKKPGEGAIGRSVVPSGQALRHVHVDTANAEKSAPNQMLKLIPLDRFQQRLPPNQAVTIGVIMASHNRRLATLRCIESLAAQEATMAIDLTILLVDDSSQDGTPNAVRACFPYVHIVEGSGDLYWGGGMRLAHQALTAVSEPDYLLWLNDDVTLRLDALNALMKTASAQPEGVVVGALLNPKSQETSYSGLIRRGRSPLGVFLVDPSTSTQIVDTFNGNVVLIPRTAYRVLGAIDAAFPHLFGDLDYGYRASKLGIRIVVAPGHMGCCERDDLTRTWEDPNLRLWQRLKHLHSVKVMSLRPRVEFLRRHGGLEWPLRLVMGYLKEYGQIMHLVKR